MYIKRTKIVCTLGPASNSVSEITNLVQAGMNCARLNFSHGDYPTHQELIDNLRIVEKNTGKRIAIIQDLQGPKIRLGKLPDKGITLKKGDTFHLHYGKNPKKSFFRLFLPIQFKDFTKGLKKDDSILFNDGLIETKVLKIISKTEVKCIVKCGGLVRSHAGVHLPSISGHVKTITEKDKKDLKFGLKNQVDYVALSFVKSRKDILDLRKLIGKTHPKIIAKIELKAAVDQLESIVKVADGIMVARGDLGIDIPAEQVPIIQKRMIALSNKYAKPVITATEVLQSMVQNPRATRAEISDAANAIFDHTDAIMLSNESAVGKYPAKAAATLSKVAINVEQELQKYQELLPNYNSTASTQCELVETNAHCLSACELSLDTAADHLIVYTNDGQSAREIAKYRIYTPIIIVTNDKKVARELTLVWGLNKIFVSKQQKITDIIQFLKQNKSLRKGEKVVITTSDKSKDKQISNITI